MKYLLSSIVVVALMLGVSSSASAQTEVSLLSVLSLKPPFDKLIPGFESETGYKVNVTYARTLETTARVAKGDAFDVEVMAVPYPEALASGNVVAGSAKTLLSFVQTIAVKKGAPRPDDLTPDTVRRMLLRATSISQVDPTNGRVGISANDMMQKLGLTERLQSKIRIYRTQGGAQTSVAMGETEICLCPYLSDPINPGVDVLGPMPPDVSIPTDLVAFVSTHSANSTAAQALIDYLASSDAALVYEEERMMVPAR